MTERKINFRVPTREGPGRPGVDPHHVFGTANLLRSQFKIVWPTLGPRLLAAKTQEEVTLAIKEAPAVSQNLADLSELILQIIADDNFPKRAKSQCDFLADSLGAWGSTGARRSRDICGEERSKPRNTIIRREFYIECTCSYKGPAENDGCPACHTMTLSSEIIEREFYST